jgi:hypothetical protein
MIMQKTLAVLQSEYGWSIINGVLSCTDRRDGEIMFTAPGWHEVTPRPEVLQAILNVFLAGFYKGSRAGQDKKAKEIRDALAIRL